MERTDLQSSQGGVPAAADSPLTSFALNGDSTRLYYFDKDGWVNERLDRPRLGTHQPVGDPGAATARPRAAR